jgi:Leucine-rich repeat (LRR) protein
MHQGTEEKHAGPFNHDMDRDVESYPHFSCLSSAHSDISDGSYSSSLSPRAAQRDELCYFATDEKSNEQEGWSFRQSCLVDEEVPTTPTSSLKYKGATGNQTSGSIRWWEMPTTRPRWWEAIAGQSDNSGRSCRSSALSFQTPPPPRPLQAHRRLSRPGAYPIQGVDARPHRDGEEEKQEESSCVSSVSCGSAHELLLEATLVSDKSQRSTTREIVRAEPLRRLTARCVCSLITLLLFIAFFAAAGGMTWGLRQKEAEVMHATGRTMTVSPVTTASPDNATTAAASEPAAATVAPTAPMRLPTGDEFTVAAGLSGPPSHGLYPPTTNTSLPTIIVSVNGISRKDFVLDLLPGETKTSLADPNSPQSFAFQWLMEDPMLAMYNGDRILQRFALATLYFSANGENWVADDGTWLSYEDECSWYSDTLDGLLCSEGQYKILSINQLSINGSLPDEVWLLSSLVSLQLFGHDLPGKLPTRIGKMAHLESLNLGGNSLTGGIPAEISKAAQLTQLYLNDNRLTGPLQESIGHLRELEELVIHNNSMTSTIPGALGGLSSLRLAYLAMNSFTGTIPELSALTELRDLVLQSNFLSGTIPDLSSLEHLEYVFLGENNLTGSLSKQWSSLTSLKVLDLRKNSLSQSIPSEVGGLANLLILDLFGNSFSSTIPASLGQLSKAAKIMLENNLLVGTIPSSLGSLTNLQRLWLHDNALSGSVPRELCDLIQSNSLDLSVDCIKVTCDCGCDCKLSTPPEPIPEGDKVEKPATAWDSFVGWVQNVFNK